MTLSVLIALLVTAGCSTLPTSGEVHRRRIPNSSGETAVSFVPPGPRPGDGPRAIVRGFLLAMQANPLSTSVARTFLTAHARAGWRPGAGTVVYQFAALDGRGASVTARLADAHRLDARGGWQGGQNGRASLLRLRLVRSHGQWRIDNPPNALVVPLSYFQGRFVPFNLYFYDQSGRVLVPEQIYVPRGEQTATTLVRGLLAGPGGALAPVVRSALPARTGLDLSVGVSDAGVAEVPLTREVLRLPPEQLTKAFRQLAWTLGQVPGVTRVRVTVDRTPVSLPDGRPDLAVPTARVPAVGPENPLLLIREGRLQQLIGSATRTAPGPLGSPGFALRTVTQAVDGHSVAAVAANGRVVYQAALSGSTDAEHVRTLYTGTDVLAPMADMYGDLWLIDRTSAGARVVVVHDGAARQVRVPGVTGRDVVSATVAPDGTRLAVALARTDRPSIRIAALQRSDAGALAEVTRARRVPVSTPDVGEVLDVDWVTGTRLALLTRARIGVHVAFVGVDGSPGDGTPTTTQVYPRAAHDLVVPPGPGRPSYLVTTAGGLIPLLPSWSWGRGVLGGVSGASYG